MIQSRHRTHNLNISLGKIAVRKKVGIVAEVKTVELHFAMDRVYGRVDEKESEVMFRNLELTRIF
jgi:hypothetical protein